MGEEKGQMNSRSKTSIVPTLGGVAVVVCVHDREKRQVITADMIAKLGRELDPPMIFNPKVHKVHLCACCENLFVDETDTPRFCSICDPLNPLKHPLAPDTMLPEPKGVVN